MSAALHCDQADVVPVLDHPRDVTVEVPCTPVIRNGAMEAFHPPLSTDKGNGGVCGTGHHRNFPIWPLREKLREQQRDVLLGTSRAYAWTQGNHGALFSPARRMYESNIGTTRLHCSSSWQGEQATCECSVRRHGCSLIRLCGSSTPAAFRVAQLMPQDTSVPSKKVDGYSAGWSYRKVRDARVVLDIHVVFATHRCEVWRVLRDKLVRLRSWHA